MIHILCNGNYNVGFKYFIQRKRRKYRTYWTSYYRASISNRCMLLSPIKYFRGKISTFFFKYQANNGICYK